MVHICALPDHVLAFVFEFCPEVLSKGIISVLSKWFRELVHRISRPRASLRREMLLNGLLFRFGRLGWRGSTVKQPAGLARITPITSMRPIGPCAGSGRTAGDYPISLNMPAVDSRFVWSCVPETIRDSLALTRMTVQCRELTSSAGHATFHAFLSDLQAEAAALEADPATRSRIKQWYANVRAGFSETCRRFVVVTVPLLGVHGARVGVRSFSTLAHLIFPLSDPSTLHTAYATEPRSRFVISPRGTVLESITRTRIVLTYPNLADQVRRRIAGLPRDVADPIVHDELCVLVSERFPAGRQFLERCARDVSRQSRALLSAVHGRKQAQANRRALQRTSDQTRLRQVDIRMTALERLTRTCTIVYREAVETAIYPAEVVNFALSYFVLYGSLCYIQLQPVYTWLATTDACSMGHYEILSWMLERCPTMEYMVDQCNRLSKSMVLGRFDIRAVNFAQAAPPAFELLSRDHPDLAERLRAGFTTWSVCRAGATFEFTRCTNTTMGSHPLVVGKGNIVEPDLTRFVNAFSVKHWVDIHRQNTLFATLKLDRVHELWGGSDLGVTTFFVSLAEYASERGKIGIRHWGGDSTTIREHYTFMEDVRSCISACYRLLVLSGFPTSSTVARIIESGTAPVVGLSTVGRVGAGDLVLLLPGCVYRDGVAMRPVRTTRECGTAGVWTVAGSFLLVAESNLRIEAGAAWHGPGRKRPVYARPPLSHSACIVELLDTCLFYPVSAGGLRGAAAHASSLPDWNAIVSSQGAALPGGSASAMLGTEPVFFDAEFESTIMKRWFAVRSGTYDRGARDPRDCSHAKVSLLYRYLERQFWIASELQGML